MLLQGKKSEFCKQVVQVTINLFHLDGFYHTCTYSESLLAVSHCVTIFPDTVLCCQEELPFSRKWFMTGLRRWFCFLYAGVDDGVVMFLFLFLVFLFFILSIVK